MGARPIFRTVVPAAAAVWDALPPGERQLILDVLDRNRVRTLRELGDSLVLRELSIERNRRRVLAARGVAS